MKLRQGWGTPAMVPKQAVSQLLTRFRFCFIGRIDGREIAFEQMNALPFHGIQQN
jgi:hypothetical protein